MAEILLKLLYAFLVGGLVCSLGQILIMKTSFTPARILVAFVGLGVLLQAFKLYEPLYELVGAGISVPITGFGGTLTKGTQEAVFEHGFIGIFTGGLTAVALGIAVVTVSAFVVSLIAKARSK
jgi:stage V sporulation protein AE